MEYFRERITDKASALLEITLQWTLQSNIVFNIWPINTETSKLCSLLGSVKNSEEERDSKGHSRAPSVYYSPAGMTGEEAPHGANHRMGSVRTIGQRLWKAGKFPSLNNKASNGPVILRIHGDLALGPSENTKIHNVQVSSTALPNFLSSSTTQSSYRPSTLSRLLTTECKANAMQTVILAHCLVKDKKNPYIFCLDAVPPPPNTFHLQSVYL